MLLCIRNSELLRLISIRTDEKSCYINTETDVPDQQRWWLKPHSCQNNEEYSTCDGMNFTHLT